MDLELEPLEDPEKSPFEVEEETGPEFSDYKGPERRVAERRSGHDRRSDVRFSGKEDRRSGKDRRKGNLTWDDFHTV